jgi:hypothetical protein
MSPSLSLPRLLSGTELLLASRAMAPINERHQMAMAILPLSQTKGQSL